MERKLMIFALMLAVSSLSWGASNEGTVMSFAHNRFFASETLPLNAAFMDAVRIPAAAVSSATIVAGESNVADFAILDFNDDGYTISDVHDGFRGLAVEYSLDGVPLPVIADPGGDGISRWEGSILPQQDRFSNTCDGVFKANGLVRDEGEFCWGRLWAADLSGLQPGSYVLHLELYDSGELRFQKDVSITVIAPS